MEPDYKQIYATQAAQYERLVAREDYHGNIQQALGRIVPGGQLDIVELGAGTGRLTRILAPRSRRVCAFDASSHMLALNAKLAQQNARNWRLAVADHRHLPLGDGTADLALSGWSICYLVVEHGDWQVEVERALAEMARVLRPGGTAILLETLGTGYETPHPPPNLAAYYAWLEQRGFRFDWIRTDCRFESLAEAVELVRFFFGDELARQVVARQWVILPECTGIWWRRV
ncbi:MAG: class I SAM-dependent methyltransferase [Thermoflexales bacterium]|nr:class I SAM-dependent methyltransferase [Thermoflexales bacterium]